MLNYTLCMAPNIKDIHDRDLPQTFWDGHSEEDLHTLQYLVRHPIWEV